MNKKTYVMLFLFAVLLGTLGFSYYSANRITGTSDNGMWEAVYKKNDETVGGWIGRLEQNSGGSLDVKEVIFMEGKKILVKQDVFTEGRAEDGVVTELDPFSADFYLGEEPKKEQNYKLIITWEKDGKIATDEFLLR